MAATRVDDEHFVLLVMVAVVAVVVVVTALKESVVRDTVLGEGV